MVDKCAGNCVKGHWDYELCERTLGLFHLFSDLCCASEFIYVSQGVGPINPGALVHFELGMWF